VAKRGYGFNFTMDQDVAIHYFNCSGKDDGYLIKASIPDREYLLNLDETIENCLPNISLYDLALELGEKNGVVLDDFFDSAAEDEGVSMSYSDNRAQEMFERFVTDGTDSEALNELVEWSPEYDWSVFRKYLNEAVGFEFDKNCSTGEDLYDHISQMLGGTEKTASFLSDLNIKGTYGLENLSKIEDSISVVVFQPDDVSILDRKDIKFKNEKKSKNKMRR